MDNKVVENNKKEDKAALKKLIIMCVCIFLVSGVLGFFTGYGKQYLKETNVEVTLREAVIHFSVYAPIIFSVIAIPVTLVMYAKCRKGFKNWDEEDEEEIAKVSGRLDIANLIINVTVCAGLVFYIISGSQIFTKNPILNDAEKGIGSFVFLLFGVVLVLLQQRIVNLKKEINPGRRGSAFEIDNLKKWLDSCDEAEKVALYRCGFVSFRITMLTCMILAVVYFFLMLIWNLSIIPIIMIGIIAIVALVAYSVEEIKNSYRG